MEEELRPCPCGNEAHLIFEDGIKVADPWSILCKNLDCPWIFQTFTTREEAVKCWNTRAPDRLLKQMAEALPEYEKLTLLANFLAFKFGGDCGDVVPTIKMWAENVRQALQAYHAHINQIEKPKETNHDL